MVFIKFYIENIYICRKWCILKFYMLFVKGCEWNKDVYFYIYDLVVYWIFLLIYKKENIFFEEYEILWV